MTRDLRAYSRVRAFHTEFAKLRAGSAQVGAHLLEASQPIGIQVVGYGRFTSCQCPGGLNLNLIADPPPPIIPK